MTSLIILVIIVIAGYLFRKQLTDLILMLFKKKRINDDILKNDGAVFSPAGTVRSFDFTLDIEEQGDGKVKISIKN